VAELDTQQQSLKDRAASLDREARAALERDAKRLTADKAIAAEIAQRLGALYRRVGAAVKVASTPRTHAMEWVSKEQDPMA